MIQHIELTTVMTLLALSGALAYKLSFFHNRKIGYLSLLQILYLLVIPGITYAIIYSEMFDILSRPRNTYVLFSDKLLALLLLMSMLVTYGGIAIHTITKTMHEYFHPLERFGLAYQVNEYYHLGFSHNLVYSGAVLVFTFFSLLELNHVSPEDNLAIAGLIIKGIFVGLATVAGLFYFIDRDKSWTELRYFFMSFWIALVLLIYSVKPYLSDIQDYPYTLMLLVSFVFLSAFNFILTYKKVKKSARRFLTLPFRLLRC